MDDRLGRAYWALFLIVLPVVTMAHAAYALGGWLGLLAAAAMLGACLGLTSAVGRGL